MLVGEVVAWAVLRAPETVDVGIAHDSEQPCPNVGTVGESVEADVSPQHRFLHEIFGVHGVAGQSSCAVVELVQIGERLVDEPRGQL